MMGDDMKTINLKIKNQQCSNFKEYHYQNKSYNFYFDGDIYNQSELLKLTNTTSLIECIFTLYFNYEYHGFNLIEGPFLFILKQQDQLCIYKDLLGLYPFYYLQQDDTIYCSNKMNQLLQLPNFTFKVSKQGLLQLFTLAPSTHLFDTIIDGIHTLGMFHMLEISDEITCKQFYYLKSKPHLDDLKQTTTKIKSMLTSSIKNQLNDCHACFLSGGLDSSIISGIASKIKPIKTYALAYEGNDQYFKANDYQVSLDDHYIDLMVHHYHLNHSKITLKQTDLLHTLRQSVINRGLVGMADIDSALLSLTQAISFEEQIILSGECSDELFGGYPWFYKKELQSNTFPWIKHFDQRLTLIHPKYRHFDYESYLNKQYQHIMNQVELLAIDSKEDYEARKQTLLVIHYFMQCLVTRQNTMSDLNGLSIRAPFANIKLLEYVYNIPWKMKFLDNYEKGILRKSFEDELPLDVLYRKKNPFPKTHHPKYAEIIASALQKRFNDKISILHELFDDHALLELIKTKGASFNTPWYGQLMSGPQLLAYLYQIDFFFDYYHLKLTD